MVVSVIGLKEYEIDRLVEYIKQNYGINLEKKHHLIDGRLCNLVKEKGFSNFRDYFQYITNQGSKEDIAVLISKLTTNHTFFMREEEHFTFFEHTVLPQLKKEVKDNDLRIWSAGCSSGEEPYTLAMIMQDFFDRESFMWDKKILATDVSREALRKAVNGVYNQEAIEQLQPLWRHHYFTKKSKEEFEVTEEIRKEIIFRIFNLMDEFPFKRKFHVIFCRNVMIYFDQTTKDKLIRKFYDITQDGGYLFIGLSESIGRNKSDYKYMMPSVYRKE